MTSEPQTRQEPLTDSQILDAHNLSLFASICLGADPGEVWQASLCFTKLKSKAHKHARLVVAQTARALTKRQVIAFNQCQSDIDGLLSNLGAVSRGRLKARYCDDGSIEVECEGRKRSFGH